MSIIQQIQFEHVPRSNWYFVSAVLWLVLSCLWRFSFHIFFSSILYFRLNKQQTLSFVLFYTLHLFVCFTLLYFCLFPISSWFYHSNRWWLSSSWHQTDWWLALGSCGGIVVGATTHHRLFQAINSTKNGTTNIFFYLFFNYKCFTRNLDTVAGFFIFLSCSLEKMWK